MSFGENLTKAAKMFGKGVAKTHKVTNTVAEHTVGKLAEGVAYGMEKTGKGTFNTLTKKVDPKFTNFYTGHEISGFGKVALPVAGAAVGYGLFVNNTAFGPKPGTVSYGGEPALMSGDGISNTTKAPTLNASGNMVFGLHNARKG
jgi:hypothetical protein